jgi:hypothetical protein
MGWPTLFWTQPWPVVCWFLMNKRLRNIRNVALDMDGTTYRGGKLIESTQVTIEHLRLQVPAARRQKGPR